MGSSVIYQGAGEMKITFKIILLASLVGLLINAAVLFVKEPIILALVTYTLGFWFAVFAGDK